MPDDERGDDAEERIVARPARRSAKTSEAKPIIAGNDRSISPTVTTKTSGTTMNSATGSVVSTAAVESPAGEHARVGDEEDQQHHHEDGERAERGAVVEEEAAQRAARRMAASARSARRSSVSRRRSSTRSSRRWRRRRLRAARRLPCTRSAPRPSRPRPWSFSSATRPRSMHDEALGDVVDVVDVVADEEDRAARRRAPGARSGRPWRSRSATAPSSARRARSDRPACRWRGRWRRPAARRPTAGRRSNCGEKTLEVKPISRISRSASRTCLSTFEQAEAARRARGP